MGGQGQDKGSSGGWMMGGSGWGGAKDSSNTQVEVSTVYQTNVVTIAPPTTIVQAQDCAAAATSVIIETTTVTAVSPCTASVVTAYVTQWMNAPPGCWCGPPPAFPSAMDMGGAAVLLGNAPVFTSTNPAFVPGLSSIPASEAVQTGVTVAAAAAVPASTTAAAVSPGVFFTTSSAGKYYWTKPIFLLYSR
ncbi:hypothetical protein A1O1_05136 [Capronia coronata CBS 617.96]|uniref:Uncharacterized protein n=1 Tax=Capronia coronata CBS 617.96 TaxID=1182541 RepID=W9YG16_9EURO|nr:uncharacterized protein A1O1_05136 [Capronia coronata CBS 617.96]EXJ88206.1 hypothetical protein A1O1_05136 [Capronia coronata CBS 617.96]